MKLRKIFIRDKIWVIILIVLIPVYGLLVRVFESEQIVKESFLCKENYTVTKKEAIERNQSIINIFLQYIDTTTQFEINHQQLSMQTKLFYAAILAALITAAILSEKKSYRIWLVVFFTCILMYGVDTHWRDIGIRLHYSAKIVGTTRDEILDISPNDTTYYSLNFEMIRSLDKEKAKFPFLYFRKICLSIKPEIEQSIYYFFPMLLSWLFYRRSYSLNRIKSA